MPLFQTARLLAKPDRLFGGKDRWKYLLRSLPIYPWSRRWASYLLSNEHCHQLVQLHPRILFKLQRPYLRKEVATNLKLRWLRQHYGWMLAQWPWAFVHQLYRQKAVELASIRGDSGQHYQLILCPADQCDKEGDLLLLLEHQNQPLAFISFTIHRRNQTEWMANIGCLQGPRPELGREAVKAATQDMYGLRPKQAVLTALYALTTGYGIEHIHAVSNDSHIYQARSRRRNRIAADYDTFWQEMGGHKEGDSFHLLPRMHRKSVADIPSRKRAQYRRRHELEDTMIAALRHSLPGCDTNQPMFAAMPASMQTEPELHTIQPVLIAT